MVHDDSDFLPGELSMIRLQAGERAELEARHARQKEALRVRQTVEMLRFHKSAREVLGK